MYGLTFGILLSSLPRKPMLISSVQDRSIQPSHGFGKVAVKTKERVSSGY
jgi:hypothetical protein